MAETPRTPNASPQTDPDETTPSRLPTALVTDAAMLKHHVPSGFPEVPDRLANSIAMIEALISNGTLAAEQVLQPAARPATPAELGAVHELAYIERIRAAVEELAAEKGPEAAPRRPCRGSAPMPRRRPPSSASRKPWPRKYAVIAST